LSGQAPRPHPAAPLSGVLLDLDGTVIDSAPDLLRAINAVRTEEHCPPLSLAEVRPHVSHGTTAVVRTGFPHADATQFDLLRARFTAHYRAALVIETCLFPGFEQVLAALEAHGIPWGIITNKAAALTEPLLREMGLFERAACVLSGDSLPARKPDPLPLLTAAQRIGRAPECCLYAGDALRDAQAARAAGMVGLGARYGYIGPHEDVADWPVTAWIDAPLELLDWVGLTGR
jgi:N-acetyl-D-muramate 6-phosphate phosphatase